MTSAHDFPVVVHEQISFESNRVTLVGFTCEWFDLFHIQYTFTSSPSERGSTSSVLIQTTVLKMNRHIFRKLRGLCIAEYSF